MCVCKKVVVVVEEGLLWGRENATAQAARSVLSVPKCSCPASCPEMQPASTPCHIQHASAAPPGRYIVAIDGKACVEQAARHAMVKRTQRGTRESSGSRGKRGEQPGSGSTSKMCSSFLAAAWNCRKHIGSTHVLPVFLSAPAWELSNTERHVPP